MLFQLLGFLDAKGMEVVRTTLDESNDNPNMPVGTQMMRIEQGMVVFSAIHKRLHAAMDKILKILHRLNATYLNDADVMKELGEQLVQRVDFEGPNDVLPASDPNIFCELQRYAQVQTVAQRAQLLPQVYDLYKVEKLILKQMRLPNDGVDLLVSRPEPTQMNPVNENVALVMGRPIVAFPEQDHESHIFAHCAFVQNPLFAMIVGNTPQSAQQLMQHLKEHISFWYAMQVHLLASMHATQVARSRDPKSEAIDIGALPQQAAEDPQIAQLYDKMLAVASNKVMQAAQSNQAIQLAVQVIEKMQQALQQMQAQQPMMDPSLAQMAETQRKAKRDQGDLQLGQQELQQKGQLGQGDQQVKLAIAQGEQTTTMQKAQLDDQTKVGITQMDNQAAQQVAAEKALVGASTNVKDGTQMGAEGGAKPI